jgi:hypothetical protein
MFSSTLNIFGGEAGNRLSVVSSSIICVLEFIGPDYAIGIRLYEQFIICCGEMQVPSNLSLPKRCEKLPTTRSMPPRSVDNQLSTPLSHVLK